MNAQITGPGGDVLGIASGGTLTFEPAEAPECTRFNIGASGWYLGPYVRWFRNAPTLPRVIDISDCATRLVVTLRYNKPGRYGDAPIFVRFYNLDASNNIIAYRDYGAVYQTASGDAPYPTWTTKTVYLNDSARQS